MEAKKIPCSMCSSELYIEDAMHHGDRVYTFSEVDGYLCEDCAMEHLKKYYSTILKEAC